jgi:hypothetical protein
MATFWDLRQAGSDNTNVKLEVSTNDEGNLVINFNDGMSDGRKGRKPEMFLVLGLLEAKQLRAALDETINHTITALAE